MEQEPFIFDPTQPELCQAIDLNMQRSVSLLGRTLGNKALEISGFVAFGYAFAERNVPLLIAGATLGCLGGVRAHSKRNQIDQVNTESSKLYDQLGVNEDTYLEAIIDNMSPPK